MQSGIRTVAVDIQQRFAQRFPSDRGQLCLIKLTQAQQKCPSDGNIGLVLEAVDQRLRVGVKRADPVDQIGTGPGIGSVFQHGPDFPRLIEFQQRDRGVGLTLGQTFLRHLQVSRIDIFRHHSCQLGFQKRNRCWPECLDLGKDSGKLAMRSVRQ